MLSISPISLWEIIALLIVIYLLSRPDLLNRITKFKFGEFEMELSELKKEINEGKSKISELEQEIENEKRQFQELLVRFDANASLENLGAIRQTLKAQARNMSDVALFRELLSMNSSHEELYAAAVSIREKRPVELFPDIITLLDNLAADPKLGGFRLNTIWTLTSATHRILIACIRDGVKPLPSKADLKRAEAVLRNLQIHPRVVNDRPDDPMKGILGPIKHSISWIAKANESNC